MILRAISGLQQHDELRYTLQERYHYIMLDEFQDTNLAQLKLIELLTNNPASEGKPNILAVGVAQGYHSKELLIKFGATVVVRDIEELYYMFSKSDYFDKFLLK
jgi:hypothetical protein